MKNTLLALKAKKNGKKGFTLMEMLIVVAIIAVLVAIAIPVFSSQLNEAKRQVNVANLRSATSMAVVDYLAKAETGDVNYYTFEGKAGDHTLKVEQTADGGLAADSYPDAEGAGKVMQITITDNGDVKLSTWAAKSAG